jgi:transcriptional regulator with XRE-family HTH domain
MNFKSIISDLVAQGMSQRQIADACGTSQCHISCLLSGRRKAPNWFLGDALLRLHAERCGTAKHEAKPGGEA